MRKFSTTNLAVLALLFAGMMSGCSDDDNTTPTPDPDPDPDPAPLAVMKIEVTETGITELKATITPDENTVSYTYAISTENDKAAFEGGTMEGIVKVANGNEATYTFSDLTPQTQYFLFTQGFNKDDKAGATVAMAALTLADDTAIVTGVEAITVTKMSIMVKVTTENTTKLFYAIGTEGDLAAFEDGSLEGIQEETRNVNDIDLTFEQLTHNTEYTVFLRGENAKGVKGPVRAEKISTLNKASVEFVPVNINSSVAHVKFVPNDLCVVHVSILARTEIIKSFGETTAEIASTLLVLAANGNIPSFGAGETYEEKFMVRTEPNSELTWVTIAISDSGESFVDTGTVMTPEFNPSAPAANVIIEEVEITSTSIEFKLTMAEGTYIQNRGTMQKAAYDMFKGIPEYWEQIMQDLLHPTSPTAQLATTQQEYIYKYDFTGSAVKPGTEMMLFLVAFNENGTQGQSEIIEYPYTLPTN